MRPRAEEAHDGQCICQRGGPIFYRADRSLTRPSVATAAAILRDRGLMENATFHDVEAIASNASRRLNPSSCIRGDKCKICC